MIHICPIFKSLFNMSKVVEQERGNFWTDQIFRVGAGALPNIYCLPASKTREYVLKFEKKVQYLLFCIAFRHLYLGRSSNWFYREI